MVADGKLAVVVGEAVPRAVTPKPTATVGVDAANGDNDGGVALVGTSTI